LHHRVVDKAKLNNHFVAGTGVLHFDEKDDRKELIRSLRSDPRCANLKLIVVDPLASFMSGSENDTRDMQVFVEGLREISRDLNCAVLVVHHEGKGGGRDKGARGSSALEAAMDTVIRLTNPDGDKKSDRPSRLRMTKQRESEKCDDIFLKFVPVPNTTLESGFADLGVFPELANSKSPDGNETPPTAPKKKKEITYETDQKIVRTVEMLFQEGAQVDSGAVYKRLREDNPNDGAVQKMKPRSVRYRLEQISEGKGGWRGNSPLLQISTGGGVYYRPVQRNSC
jgi:hypothetical protein